MASGQSRPRDSRAGQAGRLANKAHQPGRHPTLTLFYTRGLGIVVLHVTASHTIRLPLIFKIGLGNLTT